MVRTRAKLITAAILCAALFSCAKPQGPGTPPSPMPLSLVTILTLAVNAADTLLAIIGQPAGLTEQQQANLQAYVRAFGKAASVTAGEATSTHSPRQIFDTIGAAWNDAVLDPSLIAALPPDVRQYVEIARTAAAALLKAVGEIWLPEGVAAPGTATARRATTHRKMPIGDPAQLKALGARGAMLAR